MKDDQIINFLRHPAYFLTVVLVVMPAIGAIIGSGQVWIGLALIAMQAPWAICRACEVWFVKENDKLRSDVEAAPRNEGNSI